MRKVIAAMNMTLDGFCDHTAMSADDEIHQHYTDVLNRGDTMLYGRITYQLMESYWPELLKNPSGNKQENDFAVAMQRITKVVFSRTLKDVSWENARLATGTIEQEVQALRPLPGKDIYVGSPSLIATMTDLRLLDEIQICVHPVIAGKGLQLFKSISDRVDLKLTRTKLFASSGSMLFYYDMRK